jgi:DNA-directed RNA polymerase specialized sigma24 family protein
VNPMTYEAIEGRLRGAGLLRGPRVGPLHILDQEELELIELERGFRRLSAEQRAVVVLHHYLGYPLTEIAATLGIPVGTARSRLHYAIRQLRAAIEADARPMTSKERTA